MGVPKFFRYISERYPCLSELAREEKIPEFDNLYLDMNGIIHSCSHPDDGNVHFRITEEEMHKDIFNYIDKLFFLIKPRKLFFLAVDGVAPRAKMNQQRSRRFRSAKEAEVLEKNAEKRGELLPETARFDSNCITPGTEFMARLQASLKQFIRFKISNNPRWQHCRVILSGHETPGEGEHKIMEYIRYLKSQPQYNTNTRHCLYGLDADLIILGLCTHELHFSLLREEVSFGRKAKRASPEETRFYLLHLTLLREYLELEFQDLKLLRDFDIEKLIDDWILMGFLVGNDFIPHLPNMHINSNALPILYKSYIKCWPNLGGYINNNGELNLTRLQKFVDILAQNEREFFEEINSDIKYFEAKQSKEDNTDLINFDVNEIKKGNLDHDLNKLIQDTQMFMQSIEGNDDLDTEEEFIAYKRNYYIKKLKYADVTPKVLEEQTECYITAIQWILYYYYKGVSSWGWYYPHHYAPFASDLKNIEKVKIKFELGSPFLPFQQLLAVLPAASKELLPKCFRDLMINSNSTLIKYYPSDFETDLNGKKQEWEAVVLIPFIDEADLLKAMEPYMEKLTQEEIARNVQGPMLQYDYIRRGKDEKDCQESNIASTDGCCMEKQIFRKDILSSIKDTHLKCRQVYHSGFPTMKHLNYTGQLKNARVRVFEQPTRNESMILYLEQANEPKDIKIIAEKLLNKVVFIGWPHLIEAKVIAVSNREEKMDKNGQIHETSGTVFIAQSKGIYEHNLKRMGIDFQDISILVHALPLSGSEYIYSAYGKLTLRRVWSSMEISYPAQGIVSDISLQPEHREEKKVEDLFPMGSSIFMLGHPYYGCEGTVLDPLLVYSCGRMKVSITALPEPDFSEAKQIQNDLEAEYFNSFEAGNILGINSNCVARITGCIFVIKGFRRENLPENAPKINIGLHIRYPKNNEELVGYTKKAGATWMYSNKAINAIKAYYDRFPQVFELISSNGGTKDIFFESDFFTNQDEENAVTLNDVTSWLKTQDHVKAERVSCGAKTIHKEALASVISSIEKLKALPVTNVKLQVKPHLVLKPGLKVPEIYRPKKGLKLFDRVVVTKETYQVPFGHRGTVIAVHPVLDTNPIRVECINSVEIFYEILLDKELPEGSEMYGIGTGRIFKISETSVLPTFETEGRFKEDSRGFKKEGNSDKKIKSDISNNKAIMNKRSNIEDTQVKIFTNKMDYSNNGKSVNPLSEKSKNSSQGKFYDNLPETNLCSSFNKFEISKKEPVEKYDFINPPSTKTKNNYGIEQCNILQKDISFGSTSKSVELDSVCNPNSERKSFSQKINATTSHKLNTLESNKQNKNIPDKTEVLKELLGFNSRGNNKKMQNLMAANLPQPPSRWKINLNLPEPNVLKTSCASVTMRNPSRPISQEIHSSINPNMWFATAHQQYNPQLNNSQINIWNPSQTHCLIPLQALKGINGTMRRTENNLNINIQSHTSSKIKETDAVMQQIKGVPYRREPQYTKKEKDTIKRKTPKIAAKFDNI